MNAKSYWACAAALVAPLALAQCGSDDNGSSFLDGGPGDGGAGDDSPVLNSCDDASCGPIDTATPPTCGDGVVGAGEGCDDGNTSAGDGCDPKCNVESGWTCPTADLRCEAATCGDGVLAGVEECEVPPGTTVTGCTDCRIQPGYDCDPKALTCSAVVCGDGKVQRGESCEDGNDLPFDGCYKCQKEPACTGGVCQASCGDGQRFATEACDDGNTRAGDGCSPTCTLETGYACPDVVASPPPVINQPILLRDFIGVGNTANGSTAHTDFNQLNGTGVLGIVQAQLNAAGRPQLVCPGGDCTQNPGHLYFGGATRPNISTPENFAQWYTNVTGVNLASAISVALQRQADGTYTWDSANSAVNGGKTFFDPINNGGWVGAGKEVLVCSPARNVSFTSETHFWFEYQGGERFDFAGDDDTWVFVNGKLAIDLGGLHTPRTGYFILDADADGAGPDTADGSAQFSSDMPQSGAVALGLTPHGVYEVVMFQAERNQCGSNFRVTLKDFNRPKSECKSTCGDGVVASDEVCDDGKNDGSYGGCLPGCKAHAPHCGDGHVDTPPEQCDDGNTNNDDACSNTCIANHPK